MSKIQGFIGAMGKIDYYISDENNMIYLNAEQVAYGLGFIMVDKSRGATSGPFEWYTKVRWKRINEYIKSFGIDLNVNKGDYIPENVFYLLAMKAKNENAKNFQLWIANEVLPSIRREGMYIDSSHEKIRRLGSVIRIIETKAIAHFLKYAEEKGVMYDEEDIYKRLTNLANYIAEIETGTRDEASSIRLIICMIAESIIRNTIRSSIKSKVHPSKILDYCAFEVFNMRKKIIETLKKDKDLKYKYKDKNIDIKVRIKNNESEINFNGLVIDFEEGYDQLCA